MVFCNQVEHGYVKLASYPFLCSSSVSFSLPSFPFFLVNITLGLANSDRHGHTKDVYPHRLNSHEQTATNTYVSTSKAIERAVSSFSFHLSVSFTSFARTRSDNCAERDSDNDRSVLETIVFIECLGLYTYMYHLAVQICFLFLPTFWLIAAQGGNKLTLDCFSDNTVNYAKGD